MNFKFLLPIISKEFSTRIKFEKSKYSRLALSATIKLSTVFILGKLIDNKFSFPKIVTFLALIRLEKKDKSSETTLMERLRQIKIDAPEDFSANVDQYMNGEKKVDWREGAEEELVVLVSAEELMKPIEDIWEGYL